MIWQKLHTLEKAIICKRILFRNILIKPNGQMPKIKGEICNIIDVSQINKALPAGADSNGVISVKLNANYVTMDMTRSG